VNVKLPTGKLVKAAVPETDCSPLHDPLAVQEVAFSLLQVRVKGEPRATNDAPAESVTVGAPSTSTVTSSDISPPSPTHDNRKVFVRCVSGPEGTPLLDKGWGPVHAPEAVQDFAKLLVQLKVVDCPTCTVNGLAEKLSICGGGKTPNSRVTVVTPPKPVHDSVIVLRPALLNVRVADPERGLSPDQAPPLARQLRASSLLHSTVTEEPGSMSASLSSNVTAGGGITATVTVAETSPFGPSQSRV
jgi:hypothetical protein